MSWTDEKIAHLRKLAKKGLSAAQIAEELGGGFSRNAVIGKMHRLKINFTATPRAAYVGKSIAAANGKAPLTENQIKHLDKRYAAGKAKKHLGRILEKKFEERVEPTIDHSKVVSPETRVSFLELENHHCRYPIGKTPPFMFCGDPTANLAAGRPYCEAHHAICWVQPRILTPKGKKAEAA